MSTDAPHCGHQVTGRVSWPRGMPSPTQAHASTYCCDRAACIEQAASWVESITGVPGVYIELELK
jgi:hypothetical protein